MNTSKNK